MRLGLLPTSIVALSFFIAGVGTAIIAKPIWKSALIAMNQAEFSKLSFECDNAMRSHFVAEQILSQTPSEANVANLQAAEIALIDCQDYDLKRKSLIKWGLTENEVSEMVLSSIEERGGNLKHVIKVHEIRY
ncbi:hypothetical protein SAMN05444141_11411 [Pseudovibrio denitrificans]|uniref:Uncharacterized protein n=1 Tax=Pseudovibrio denitrificans TaxID=258256 RepID=A0A1I7DZB6_9HYPH|nr:TIGR03982 family His-Xaa-Ser system protein [Pseudovibrio denitrificans]SFU17004.1 hypothetical protein SAMN05444141_11411 [Pseudovibrio denitrificans]